MAVRWYCASCYGGGEWAAFTGMLANGAVAFIRDWSDQAVAAAGGRR